MLFFFTDFSRSCLDFSSGLCIHLERTVILTKCSFNVSSNTAVMFDRHVLGIFLSKFRTVEDLYRYIQENSEATVSHATVV